MDASDRIIRVLEVRDTRKYEEVEPDKWKPIPGSGIENQCARCGRMHEVHVLVELEGGSSAVVGSSCCDAESMDVQSRIKSGVAAAKTARRLEGQLELAVKKLSAHQEKEAEIRRAMGSQAERAYGTREPVIRLIVRPTERGFRKGEDQHVLVMGDVEHVLWEGQHGKPDAQDYQMLDGKWIEARLREAGFTGQLYLLKETVLDLEKRLRRAMARAAYKE